MQNRIVEGGFTLVELMITTSIIGVLASLGITAYQNYSVRAQVSDGIRLAGNVKQAVADAYLYSGSAPANRAAVGMSPNAQDTQGKFVSSVDIENGVIVVTFGNESSAAIQNLTLSVTPYETQDLGIVWRCGLAPAPTGLNEIGTSGGSNAAVYVPPSVPIQYLPPSCRG